jgi:hypothetical protein
MSTTATTAAERATRDADLYASYVMCGQNVAATTKSTGIAASTVRDSIKRHLARTAETTSAAETAPAAEVTPAAEGGMLARLVEPANAPETPPATETPAEDAPAAEKPASAPRPASNGDVLVVYRSTKSRDDGTGRMIGETGDDAAQFDADRMWWPIGADRQGSLKGIAYVVNGKVARVRAVVAGGTWGRDERGRASVPVTSPLTADQVAELLPGLPFALGGAKPAVRGKIREYVTL